MCKGDLAGVSPPYDEIGVLLLVPVAGTDANCDDVCGT